VTVSELVAGGVVRPAAVVALVLSLADACDGDPENASLFREYRAALGLLLAVDDVGESDGDGIEGLRELLAG